MFHALLIDLPTLLRMVTPERTVKVKATRKLTYIDRQYLPGESFLCDAPQAAEWIKSGLVKR